MTDKNDYTARIRAKGLDNTGVTEDIAKSMFNSLGRSTLAIVELEHKRKIDDDDTGRTVELVIRMIEPSTSETLDTHLRELTKTMHQNRVLTADDQQLQIETAEDLEPTIEGVIAAGQAHIAETDDELPDPDNEEAEGAGDDPYSQVHAKGGKSPGEETPCGLRATSGKSLHTHPDDDKVTCTACLTELHGDSEPWDYPEPEGNTPEHRPADNPFATTTS